MILRERQETFLSDSSALGQQNSLDLRGTIPSIPIHLSSAAELVETLDLLSTLTALEISTFFFHFSFRKPEVK